jgi:hypothetical protein
MFRHSDSVISVRVLISPTGEHYYVQSDFKEDRRQADSRQEDSNRKTGDKTGDKKTGNRKTGNRKTDGRKTGRQATGRLATGGSRMNIPDKHYVVNIPNLNMSSLFFCIW